MTSLTTLFVVGPEEYVEFNESMGSKAFLEHVWDEQTTPLKPGETSLAGSQLHSAGARISPDPPPRIEFPIVLRVRGRGNKYRPTGRFISWQELKRRNPIALTDPPSLDEFVERGSQVGTAERVEPGAFLKGETRSKASNKAGNGKVDVQQSSDGWFGGSSESDYAAEPKEAASGSSQSIYAPKTNNAADQVSEDSSKPKRHPLHREHSDAATVVPDASLPEEEGRSGTPTPSSIKSDAPTLRKSRSGLSLSERLGLMDRKEGPRSTSESNASITPRGSPNISTPETPAMPHQRAPRPPRITLPDPAHSMGGSIADRLHPSSALARTPVAQTPLSASHTPPETPLKHDWQQGSSNEIVSTPRTEEALNLASANKQMRGGLMLSGPGFLPQGLQTPPVSSVMDSSRGTLLAHAKVGSSSALKDAASQAAATSPPAVRVPARSQIDEMLAKLRLARSTGSSGSMWAPKGDVSGGSSDAVGTVVSKVSQTASDASLVPEAEANQPAKTTSQPVPPSALRAMRENGTNVHATMSLGESLGEPDLTNAQDPTEATPEKAGDFKPAKDDVEKRQEPPKEPRGLREQREKEKTSTHAKTLLDRLGPPPSLEQQPLLETVDEAKKGGKPKRERRRKSKALADDPRMELYNEDKPRHSKSEKFPETTVEPVPSAPPAGVLDEAISRSGNDVTAEKVTLPDLPSEESADVAASTSSHQGDDASESQSETGSIVSEHETSHFGNETLTSINWADDDDDESLPDLPEEWTRRAPLMSPIMAGGATNGGLALSPGTTASLGATTRISEGGTSTDEKPGSSARGSRRGANGRPERRGKHRAGSGDKGHGASAASTRGPSSSNPLSKVSPPPVAPKSGNGGMQIAGRAANQNSRQQPRELFPESIGKSASVLSSRSRGSSRSDAREREHARPRPSTNEGGAFARMTKGALESGEAGVSSSRHNGRSKGSSIRGNSSTQSKGSSNRDDAEGGSRDAAQGVDTSSSSQASAPKASHGASKSRVRARGSRRSNAQSATAA